MKLSKKLQDIIKVAIEDGELDEKEKTVLFERAQSEGISPDEFEIYLNSRLKKIKEELEEKKKEEREIARNRKILMWIKGGIIGAFCLLIGWTFYDDQKDAEEAAKEANENYNWSYEKACENGDFTVAHKLLSNLQEDVLMEKEREKDHQIKKEKKTHWFKDDEIVVDSVSVLDHEQYIQGLENKGRVYLAGLDYVYNAEIAYVKESNEDGSSEKVKHLLSELRTKILLFRSLDMEDEAQEVYNKLAQKVGVAANEGAEDSAPTP